MHLNIKKLKEKGMKCVTLTSDSVMVKVGNSSVFLSPFASVLMCCVSHQWESP